MNLRECPHLLIRQDSRVRPNVHDDGARFLPNNLNCRNGLKSDNRGVAPLSYAPCWAQKKKTSGNFVTPLVFSCFKAIISGLNPLLFSPQLEQQLTGQSVPGKVNKRHNLNLPGGRIPPKTDLRHARHRSRV